MEQVHPAALEAGMVAAAGIPMVVGPNRIGALNVYDDKARSWPEDVMATSQLLADMALHDAAGDVIDGILDL